MPKTVDPFFDHYAHLKTFPDFTLRDLARNDCAPHDYRKFAVELLYNRKSPLIKHEDLRPFVHELEIELDGIVFESAPSSGALVASITTETMFADTPTGFTGFDEVQIMDEAAVQKALELSPPKISIRKKKEAIADTTVSEKDTDAAQL